MANMKYFAGEQQLQGVHERNGKLFGYVSKDDLHFVAGQGWQGYTAVERTIEYKSNPSRHECDARCLNATGRIMKCECACGGKNHGRGFIAEAAPMKTPAQIHAETVRDITLATIIAMFVIGAVIAAAIAADRKIAEECRAQQEYRPCR